MVKIIADSTCDLSEDLLRKYDISVLPLHILLGEEEYEDGTEITPDEIYKWSDEHRTTPKTSAISIDNATGLFRTYLDQGKEIVCFSISETMSTTANVMRLAVDMLDASSKISVVDSANLSTGIGLLVIEAAIMAAKGYSAGEIVREVEKMKPKVRSSFVVDTLTYLYRGGRCSAVAALAGGALKMHPKIEVSEGKMDAGKKYRGKMDRVIMHYVSDIETELKSARKERAFITHSGCDQELISQVYGYLSGFGVFEEILVTRAGGVISSHCGPGTLGVLYMEE